MFVVVVSEVWRTAFFNSLLIVQGDYNIHYVLVLSLFNHALYISNTYSQVFGWTDSTIMQFALWGCLDFPIFFLPAAILLTYSLRGSVVFVILIPQNSTHWNISHFFVPKSWCLFVLSTHRWQAPVVWLLEPVLEAFPSSFQTSNLTSRFFAI